MKKELNSYKNYKLKNNVVYQCHKATVYQCHIAVIKQLTAVECLKLSVHPQIFADRIFLHGVMFNK